MPYLLDTSALSEPIRKAPSPEFMTRLGRVPASELFTSSVCVMELRYGCALKRDSQLWNRIGREILARVQVLAFGEAEAIPCGDILAALTKTGLPVGVEDTQIAATALAHDLTLVTANLKHFRRIAGLRVEDWLDRQ